MVLVVNQLINFLNDKNVYYKICYRPLHWHAGQDELPVLFFNSAQVFEQNKTNTKFITK